MTSACLSPGVYYIASWVQQKPWDSTLIRPQCYEHCTFSSSTAFSVSEKPRPPTAVRSPSSFQMFPSLRRQCESSCDNSSIHGFPTWWKCKGTRIQLSAVTVLKAINVIALRGGAPGALFITLAGHPYSANTARVDLQTVLTFCRLDTGRYNSLSLRIGAASDAAPRGFSDAQIRLLGR